MAIDNNKKAGDAMAEHEVTDKEAFAAYRLLGKFCKERIKHCKDCYFHEHRHPDINCWLSVNPSWWAKPEKEDY